MIIERSIIAFAEVVHHQAFGGRGRFDHHVHRVLLRAKLVHQVQVPHGPAEPEVVCSLPALTTAFLGR